MATIAYIITSDLSASTLLKGQLRYVREHGHRVVVLCAPGPRVSQIREREGVEVVTLPFEREIDPIADLRTLAQLIVELRRLKPDVVNASTPKAGLLGSIAAAIARVPRRIYTVRGLRYETAVGHKRRLLTSTERAAALAATHVIAVSSGIKAQLEADRICASHKIQTIGAGSSNGIDLSRFRLDPARAARVEELREQHALDGVPVIGFVGRFVHDKGFTELVRAFADVQRTVPAVRLLLVGDYEAGDPVDPNVRAALSANPAVTMTGFVTDVALYYPLMSVLAFPSYREGFPNVPLEAAAFALPSVGFAATGTTDAILDGTTGTIVPSHDAVGLGQALVRYLLDPALRTRHGSAARERAEREFAPKRVWDGLLELYERG